MSTQFDKIAADYNKSFRHVLYREFMELPSTLALIGDTTGLTVLDVACGTGVYTRTIRRHGADKVIGVDVASDMVGVARAIEEKEPLGIEYIVSDIAAAGELGQFDFVTAIYLLHYATSKDHLKQICTNIARNMKPGARFLTFVINPAIASDIDFYKPYNFYMEMTPPLEDGSQLKFVTVIDNKLMEVYSRYWHQKTLETALTEAGLTDIRWIKPHVSPEGIALYGEALWHNYSTVPHCIFIEAFKK